MARRLLLRTCHVNYTLIYCYILRVVVFSWLNRVDTPGLGQPFPSIGSPMNTSPQSHPTCGGKGKAGLRPEKYEIADQLPADWEGSRCGHESPR